MSTSERKALAAFRGLLEATAVPEAMAHVAAVASASAGADLAAVFLRVDGEARLRLVAGDGCPAGLVGTLELALGDGAPAALALERRAPVFSTEVEASVARATDPLLEACALTSWVATPVVHAGEPIGALLVGRRDGPALGATEAALCSSIGDLAAVAVDRLRAAAEGDRRRQETEALEAIGRELTSGLDHAVMLQRITDRARDLAGGDLAFIAPVEAGGQAAVVVAVSGAREPLVSLRMEPGRGVGGRVLITGEPFVTEHYLTDPRVSQEHAEIIVAEGICGEVVLPLRFRGQITGVLGVASRTPRVWTDADLRVLGKLADHAAVAIENARLLGEARVREERLRTLSRVNQVVSASLDLDGVLGAIVRAATELFGGTPAWIWTADAAEQVVESRAFSDPRLHEGYPVRRAALNEGFVGWVAAHRTMIEVPDVFADPRYLRTATDWWEKHGLRSFVGVPIIQDGHLLGVLSFAASRPLHLGAEERELLDTLVGQAALAMRNARLFAATEGREREASALYDVTRRLAATLDSEEILQIVSEGTAKAMESNGAGFYRWEPAEGHLVMTRSQNGVPNLARSLRIRAGEGIGGRAFAERRVCWTDDWMSDTSLTYSEDNAAAMVKSASARAFIAAPVILRDGVYGVLMTGYTHPHTHTDADVRLMTTLAGQAAIALENARLLDATRRREAEVAHKSALLETTLESMGQGLVAFDGELRLAAWNSRALDIMRVAPDFAWMGRPFEEFCRVVAERGEYGPGDPAAQIAERLAQARQVPAPPGRAGAVQRPHHRGPGQPHARGRLRVDVHRHHRAQARGGGAAAGARRGRGGEPGQERVPGHDEPRDPHADERGDRHDGAPARHAADPRAARVRGDGAPLRRGAAHDHQRHPGLLEDGGGQARDRADPVRCPHGGRRRHRPRAPGGGGQGARAGGPHRSGAPAARGGRPGAHPTDPAQPGVQRHQVHRARACPDRDDRAAAGDRRGAAHRGDRYRDRHRRGRPARGCSRSSARRTPPRPGSTAAPAWAWRSPSAWSS